MRTIVSAIGSPSYNLAKKLARFLTLLVGNTLHMLKNSVFMDRIKSMEMEPHDQPISFYVTNLFTQYLLTSL